jgi:uncharacterized membrane protein
MITWLTSTYIGQMAATFFIAMVPVIELRGALPFGVALGLDPIVSLVVSILGNMVPVPFIVFFIEKIFEWMRRFEKFRRTVEKMEARAAKHENTINKYKSLGLFILVAIPLPGTGAWTGSLVAALFKFPVKKAFFVIFLGVTAAGIIVFLITYGVVLIV